MDEPLAFFDSILPGLTLTPCPSPSEGEGGRRSPAAEVEPVEIDA